MTECVSDMMTDRVSGLGQNEDQQAFILKINCSQKDKQAEKYYFNNLEQSVRKRNKTPEKKTAPMEGTQLEKT